MESARPDTTFTGSGIRIDEIDRKLLQSLEREGRATVKGLAEEHGLSRATIHSRMRALAERDVFKVLGLVNPDYLGRPAVIVFFIKVLSDAAQVLEDVWALPEISWAGAMTDAITVLAQGSFANLAEAAEFTNTRLRAHPTVDEVDPHVLTEVLNPARTGQRKKPAWYTAARNEPLDPVDLAIAQILQRDGRTPFAQLAEAAGLSVAATRQRAVKLMESGIVQIRTIIDPAALGRQSLGIVCIKLRGSATTVMHQLADMADVHYVDQTLGTYPILSEFHSRTLADLEQRRREIDLLPDVRSTRLLLLQKTTTYGGNWV
ncbi:Lrp/AsnC family transcriptional regulator [Nocardia miyunensis]|uniref:Lrp/AsnC family transcriptional regulator n=1 Tax=Nocardia miyunensis TaxID=282684 RepID=UPI00083455AF|nr:Lrp/AsnC family transcriptional regulator [Nocardia miyunensis]